MQRREWWGWGGGGIDREGVQAEKAGGRREGHCVDSWGR
jgi:hypothetical protein